ncbi:hypothetical protein FXB41_40410 [Bradyrhizobium canariense]|uniref:hypothetical protein n=1 Tax=Bradyrhizobium canariense TaxID=255045 RepID=UPI001CA56613|nr:hypothetical protein [Bradyrhizobium canariense]MBW5440784.1 hypothetical protein [Bradyrhizobium canariense]
MSKLSNAAAEKRRCFMVEIDRGTMPISRPDFRQTSFQRKMQAYLAAHAQGQHTQQFGWKTFRVLVVTTDQQRAQSMIETSQRLSTSQSLGPFRFLFSRTDELERSDLVDTPLRGWPRSRHAPDLDYRSAQFTLRNQRSTRPGPFYKLRGAMSSSSAVTG